MGSSGTPTNVLPGRGRRSSGRGDASSFIGSRRASRRESNDEAAFRQFRGNEEHSTHSVRLARLIGSTPLRKHRGDLSIAGGIAVQPTNPQRNPPRHLRFGKSSTLRSTTKARGEPHKVLPRLRVCVVSRAEVLHEQNRRRSTPARRLEQARDGPVKELIPKLADTIRVEAEFLAESLKSITAIRVRLT